MREVASNIAYRTVRNRGTMTRIALTVNGTPVQADVEPRTHLADFLREQQLLTGTNLGCEHGVCGACTLEIDGAPGPIRRVLAARR